MNRPSVLITVALSLLAAVLNAKEPSLKTVLARASGYVERFERDLAGIVAEEHYMQDVEAVDALPSQPPAPLLDASHRELRSDLLLVRTGGSDQYVQFRDVFVDLYVPVEMHETYRQRNYPYRITGTATYSNFRRFDVTVNESFRLIGR